MNALDLISEQNELMISWLSWFLFLPGESIGYTARHVLSYLGMGEENYFLLKMFFLCGKFQTQISSYFDF